MKVLEMWKQNIFLLLPHKFLPFFLEVIRTIMRIYITWLRYFWWALLFYLLFLCVPYMDGFSFLRFYAKKLQQVTEILLGFTILLSGRSTVVEKNLRYFERHTLLFAYFYILCRVAAFLMSQKIKLSGRWQSTQGFFSLPFGFWMVLVGIQLYMLFLFSKEDKLRPTFKMMGNTFKMIFYNFPFFLLLYGLFYAMRLILYTIPLDLWFRSLKSYFLFTKIVYPVAFMVLLPIPVAFLVAFYRRQMNENRDMYSGV